MNKRVIWLVLFGLFVMFFNRDAALVAAPDAGETARITRTIDGTNPNRMSQFADMSGNGRYITYSSVATNLAVGDDNNASDIFVYDRDTNQTERVSVRTDGGQANGSSYVPAISDDGRYVVFQSFATNLVDDDTNNVSDIFYHDRQTNETFLVSFVIDEIANDFSLNPDISGNGRYMVFTSFANNLVDGDNNSAADVFLFNREGRTLERVSLDSNEVEGNGNSQLASISDDGTEVVFESLASNLVTGDANTYADIFLRDLSAGATTRISVHTNGTEGNGASSQAVISGDGTTIAFASLANNLTDNDSNSYQDIFAYTVSGSSTSLVSVASDGTVANRSSKLPSISDNGRYVSFETVADTLTSGDGNGFSDIYVKDLVLNTVSIESVKSNGVIGNFASEGAVLSSDGRMLVFASESNNLVLGDANGVQDIFFRKRFNPPSASFDFPLGSPGSQFILTGIDFLPNSTAMLTINNQPIGGTINIGNDGAFTAKFHSNTETDEGTYVVVVTSGDDTAVAGFTIANGAPARPPSGFGFAVPDGIAYQNMIYLPLILKN